MSLTALQTEHGLLVPAAQLCHWCAPTRCGVLREIFDDGLQMSTEIRFHVYLTTRRIFFRIGGIQSIPAHPGDPKLNPKKKPYDVASFHRLFNESGVSPTTDFRLIKGHNPGVGSELIWVSYPGPTKTEIQYPGGAKFSVEGGSAQKGDLIQ